MKASLNSPGVFREVEVSAIKLNPEQPRKNVSRSRIADLANSIKAAGLLHPVAVVSAGSGAYKLVAGERRVLAFRLLKRDKIPAHIVDENAGDEIALIENIQRVNLTPFEEAAAYERLRQSKGYSQAELANAVGKGRTYVTKVLGLLSLPKEVRVVSEKVSKSMLLEFATLSPSERSAAWKQIEDGKLTTVRDLRAFRNESTDRRAGVRAAIQAARLYLQRLKELEPETRKEPDFQALLEEHRRIVTMFTQDLDS